MKVGDIDLSVGDLLKDSIKDTSVTGVIRFLEKDIIGIQWLGGADITFNWSRKEVTQDRWILISCPVLRELYL